MNTLIDIVVGKGWTAFYLPASKKVFGVSEFVNGAKGKTSLSVITKPTKAELLAEIEALGLVYTPPQDPPSS